jgi:hypothetical protein
MATDQTGIFDAIGRQLFGFYSIVIIAVPLLDFLSSGPLLTDSTVGPAVVAIMAAFTVVANWLFQRRLEVVFYGQCDPGDSLWDELVLFTFTYISAIVLSALVLLAGSSLVLDTAVVPPVVHHVVAITASLAVIYSRRRDVFEFPSWLRTDSWGILDHLVLFGAVFLLTYGSLNSAFGPTGELLTAASLLCAITALGLRVTGAFSREVKQRPQMSGRNENRV